MMRKQIDESHPKSSKNKKESSTDSPPRKSKFRKAINYISKIPLAISDKYHRAKNTVKSIAELPKKTAKTVSTAAKVGAGLVALGGTAAVLDGIARIKYENNIRRSRSPYNK